MLSTPALFLQLIVKDSMFLMNTSSTYFVVSGKECTVPSDGTMFTSTMNSMKYAVANKGTSYVSSAPLGTSNDVTVPNMATILDSSATSISGITSQGDVRSVFLTVRRNPIDAKTIQTSADTVPKTIIPAKKGASTGPPMTKKSINLLVKFPTMLIKYSRMIKQ